MALLAVLEKKSCIPVLTWHHVCELLQNQSSSVVETRIEVIRSLPIQLAWVAAAERHGPPGTVVDVLRAEVAATCSNKELDVVGVRDEARSGMFQLGYGPQVLGAWCNYWPLLEQELANAAARTREIVAISRARQLPVSCMKVVDVLRMPTRTTVDQGVLSELRAALGLEVQTRGDSRIPNPHGVAARFYSEIEREANAAFRAGSSPFSWLFGEHEVDEGEITPSMTVNELGELMELRQKLRVASSSLPFSWQEIKSHVSRDLLPSQVVHTGLRACLPDTKRRDGSELTDLHIAALGAYVHVLFVDKRVHEAHVQASRKFANLQSLATRFAKAADYSAIEQHI